jgi:putative transposase
MPWHGVSTMDLRLEFVRAYHTGRYDMTELCQVFAISRPTGYKWMDRFERHGRAGLVDQSRRPHTSPHATPPTVVALLCEARRRHPTWSARKLMAVLKPHHPEIRWPAKSTGCAHLKAAGLVRARRRHDRHRAPAGPLAPITAVNETWTTDFKGEFRTGDHRYCYPLTLRDGFSRYVLRCDALRNKSDAAVRPSFERAFREFGLPIRIRSDNGGPFAATGLTRLSRLSVWWMRLGIYPERIALGHPEQNGSHEQFHRVLKAETARPPAADVDAQQRRFRRFAAEYNDLRPHEALNDHPPASCYIRSSRAYPRRLPPIEYAGHMEVRRVNPTGQISWRGRSLYVAEALGGEDVGLEEIDDGIWVVYFSFVRFAQFDERTRCFTGLRTRNA